MNTEPICKWLAAKLPGATFDASGMAVLRRDPDTHIVLELTESGDLCHFCGVVAPLDESHPEASLLAALELNRFGKPLGGCWLAWEPDIQMLTLCWNMHVATADEAAFSNAIDNFVAAMDSARAELMPAPREAEPHPLSQLA